MYLKLRSPNAVLQRSIHITKHSRTPSNLEKLMSIYEKLDTAMENNDAKAYADLLHDDFKFVRHATNTAMTKSEWVKVISNMMESGKVTRSNSRCIYENDDVLVSHSLVSFPDGSSEAVLVCFTLSNGKIIRSETGATPIS